MNSVQKDIAFKYWMIVDGREGRNQKSVSQLRMRENKHLK